jgi:hypothetical protein
VIGVWIGHFFLLEIILTIFAIFDNVFEMWSCKCVKMNVNVNIAIPFHSSRGIGVQRTTRLFSKFPFATTPVGLRSGRAAGVEHLSGISFGELSPTSFRAITRNR